METLTRAPIVSAANSAENRSVFQNGAYQGLLSAIPPTPSVASNLTAPRVDRADATE